MGISEPRIKRNPADYRIGIGARWDAQIDDLRIAILSGIVKENHQARACEKQGQGRRRVNPMFLQCRLQCACCQRQQRLPICDD